MEAAIIYITAKDAEDTRKIRDVLLKEKLIACGNVIPKSESCYWWKGKIESEEESLLIAKTKKSLVKEVIKRVKEVHSYTIPCILALPIIDGNPDYLKWIDEVTK